MILEPCTNKRCSCGNQYVEVEGFLYCHACDIEDGTLKAEYDDKGYVCNCDYCKRRAVEKGEK